MYRVGFRYKPLLNLRDPRVLQVLRLIGPAVLGVAAVPINQLTSTWFMTSADEWISWINGAYRIMHLPIGMFGVAISTVALPQLAKFANAGDTEDFRNSLSYALRLMLTVIVPAAIGLMVCQNRSVSCFMNVEPSERRTQLPREAFCSSMRSGYADSRH